MADPVLDAHRVQTRVYRLSGPQPGSIRDQMIRGQILVERLLDDNVLKPGQKLLVVGAGAAGATAALTAVGEGIETLLVDRAAQPFLTQHVSPRIIDPVEYDWPVDHWDTPGFP